MTKALFTKFHRWIPYLQDVSSSPLTHPFPSAPKTPILAWSARGRTGDPRNVSSVIIVRAREAFRGNGNNSRFESSTSLSAFDERAQARSLCTNSLYRPRWRGRGTGRSSGRVRIVKDRPIISAHRAPLLIFHRELARARARAHLCG